MAGAADRRRIPFYLATLATIGLLALGSGFGDPGARSLRLLFGGDVPSGWLLLLFAATWAAGWILMFLMPWRREPGGSVRVILALALICRLLLIAHPPSDDVNRYLWEGRMVREGVNPYRIAPGDPTLAPLAAQDPYHADINHPDHPAIYPPGVLILFALLGRIGYDPFWIKAAMIAFDMGALFFLLALMRERDLPLRWAMLYAVNPVLLYGFAGQGHMDAAQLFFLTGAVFFHDRGRWGWMFAMLGLAVQSKYVAGVACPCFVCRDNLPWTGIGLLTAGGPFLPFIRQDPLGMLAPFFRFAGEFAFNGSVHGMLRWLTGDIRGASAICGAILFLALIFGYAAFHPRLNPRHAGDPVSGCFFALGAVILLSPTVHFWYVSWIWPFLVLRGSAAWHLLSLTVGVCLVASGYQHHTGQWLLPAAWRIAEWAPIWLLLIQSFPRLVARMRTPPFGKGPETLSVVIPTRNESRTIRDCLSAIREDNPACEVIVVDGGSTDDTAALASAAGARVILHASPPEAGGGRGGQIRAGVKAAAGDAVVVVHADTRIAPGTTARILRILASQPMVAGGAVGGLFAGRGLHLRLLETANDFRASCMGISFGDQVQFFRRQALEAAGGFPDQPLMEDVELSLRLSRLGRTVYLFGDASLSDRRWRCGSGVRMGLIVRLFAAYLWSRLQGKTDTLSMFRRYYGG